MNKKVLFVNYCWVPDNAAGVHRPLRFVRHLRQFGWEPVVLCAKPLQYTRYDQQLIGKVPDGVETIRAAPKDPWSSFQHWRGKRIARRMALSTDSGNEPGNLDTSKKMGMREIGRKIGRKIVAWAEPWYYHPDYYMGWIQPAVASMLRNPVCKDLSVIFSSGGPWSNFEVGYRLSKMLRIPLILDFRDGWTITYNSFEARRPAWARKWDCKRLERYFLHSKSVVFLHEFYAECYLQKFGNVLEEKKIHIIPNGFERISFDMADLPSRGDRLIIVYAGTLSFRKYHPLFNVLHALNKRQPHLRFKFLFIGDSQNEAIELSRTLGLTNWIDFIPPVSFQEATSRMRQSHALLMLGESPLPGYELWIGSKVFQYLALRRPVLGILPDNASMRLLKNVGAGPLADSDSECEIEQALTALHQAWENDTLNKYLPSVEKIAEYSEPGLTKALTLSFEGMPPAVPYKKGMVPIPKSLQNKL